MQRSKLSRITFAFLFLSSLLPFFQNCSKQTNSKVNFSSVDQPKDSSGNGQPYEGKPDPGDYYRNVPGYTCNGVPSLAGKITVSDHDIHSITVNPDCSQSPAELSFSDVETSSLNRAEIGFKDGIFQKSQQPPDPNSAASETWCRSLNSGMKAFEVLIDSTLQGSFKIATGVAKNGVFSRSQNGSALHYQSAGQVLDLDLSVQASEPGEVRGFLTASEATGEVACRSTVNRAPAPTGGYFVLTAATTQANFGGLKGANQFCLQDLSSHDWKGKVNVIVDADHVFAFNCDASTCQNLDPLHSYAFALSGDPTIGGHAFMTDAGGSGPGSQFEWNSSDVFGGTYLPWSNRSGDMSRSDYWDNVPSDLHCNNWTSNSNLITGQVGITSSWNAARWNNGGNQCDETRPMYCVVRAP